jgi:4,5-DOPA dioxygenase extradiol
MVTAPAFFLSHGAPTFALEPGLLGARLAEIGHELDAARAVLVVSAHWQTHGVKVMTTALPVTIHDFSGFPQPLYSLQYPARGDAALAEQAATLLQGAGFAVTHDSHRGLDHGAWVPLLHLRPAADIPVFQVSLPWDLDAAGALRLGAALAPLRRQGVVVAASGGLTHNLHEFRLRHQQPAAYAAEFAAWTQVQLRSGNVQALLDYRHQAPHATRSHPTDEHYLPLFVALGARLDGDAMSVLEGGITHGVLAMDSYAFAGAH